MLWYLDIAFFAVLFSAGVCFGLLSQQGAPENTADQKVPYPHRPFSFSYKNNSSDMVWVRSVDVLGHTVGSGRMWARNRGGGGVGDRRKDCTPEALLATQAKFLWWEMEDPKDFNAARRGPDDPSKRLQYSLPFPEFDVEADAWRCFYTLQEDDTWVGMFEGVVSKPIGDEPVPVDPSLPGANQQWIHFQFRNMSDHVAAFSRVKTRLVNGEVETLIKFPAIPADGRFHCVTGHSHEGSIYRPTKGSRLELSWYFRGGDKMRSETIHLPVFSPEETNWYCYLTVDSEGRWTAEFEGAEP